MSRWSKIHGLSRTLKTKFKDFQRPVGGMLNYAGEAGDHRQRSTTIARLASVGVMKRATVISGDAGRRLHHAMWSLLILSVGVQ